MPEMDGSEAAMVLQKTVPQVPLFMITSHDIGDVESKSASLEYVPCFPNTRASKRLWPRRAVLKPFSRISVTAAANNS